MKRKRERRKERGREERGKERTYEDWRKREMGEWRFKKKI